MQIDENCKNSFQFFFNTYQQVLSTENRFIYWVINSLINRKCQYSTLFFTKMMKNLKKSNQMFCLYEKLL